jgi:hypothetical protein
MGLLRSLRLRARCSARYAHFAAKHLAKAAARIDPSDTKMATAKKQNGTRAG